MSERLTKRKDYGCACWNGDQNIVTHRRYMELLDALAKYEDVTFGAGGNEIISLACLRELVKADAEGRVVVLPCKVGDIVFALAHCGDVRYFCDNDYETGTGATTCPFEKQCGIQECENDDLHVFAVEVAGFYFGEKNPMDGAVIVNELDVDLSLSDFGKRMFVTEAEAARALAEKGEAT